MVRGEYGAEDDEEGDSGVYDEEDDIDEEGLSHAAAQAHHQ